jgi:hypothetical protein
MMLWFDSLESTYSRRETSAFTEQHNTEIADIPRVGFESMITVHVHRKRRG